MTCVLFPTLQVSQSLYLSLSLVSLSFYLYPFYSPHRKLLASLFLSSLSTSISCGDHRSSPPTNHELLPTSFLPFLPVNSPSSSPLFYRCIAFPTDLLSSLLNRPSFTWASWFLLPVVFLTPLSLRRDVATLRRSAAARILASSYPQLYRRFLVCQIG